MKNTWHQKYIKDVFTPDSGFDRHCKTVFLKACETKFGVKPTPVHGAAFFILVRSLSTAVVAALMLSSVSAFADQTNAGLHSALYPLKRIYEKVEFGLAGAEKRETLQIKLATRRLEEAKQENAAPAPDSLKSSELLTEARENAEKLLVILEPAAADAVSSYQAQTPETVETASMPAPVEKPGVEVERRLIPKPDPAPLKIAVPEKSSPETGVDTFSAVSAPAESVSASTTEGNKKNDLPAQNFGHSEEDGNKVAPTERQEQNYDKSSESGAPAMTTPAAPVKPRNIRLCEKAAPIFNAAESLDNIDDKTAAVINELNEACLNIIAETDVK